MFSTDKTLINKNKTLEKENNDIKHHTNILVDSLLSNIQILENDLVNAKKGYTQENIKNIIYELYKNSSINYECIVCLDDIDKNNLQITDCGHYYCIKCYNSLSKCSSCDRDFK